jgi:hypothetical protein
MSFKTKNKVKKKEDFDTRVTLDAKHNEKLNEFQSNLLLNQKKKKLLKRTEKKLEIFKERKLNSLNDDEMRLKLSLEDKIKQLNKEICEDNSREDINYLLETGDLLFKYYENKQNVAEGKNIKINDIKKTKTNSKSVMEYFSKNKEEKKDRDNIPQNQSKNNFLSRSNIYENYMSKIDDNYVINYENKIDICETCNVEKTLFISDGKLICFNCGEETPILIDSDKPSYKDPPREVCYFAYKRINHFNEWLAQFQAKESTDIPQSVYNDIIVELKKERIVNIKELTPIKLREILKKLKKNKYYEHIPHIINKLNGVPPPVMNRKTEEELRRMFKEIQVPFHKFCPENRKNFLSYSYVLHKFVQLLELDDFLPCFMLLKSREKLQQQDQIWKKICEYLKWQYIPSL